MSLLLFFIHCFPRFAPQLSAKEALEAGIVDHVVDEDAADLVPAACVFLRRRLHEVRGVLKALRTGTRPLKVRHHLKQVLYLWAWATHKGFLLSQGQLFIRSTEVWLFHAAMIMMELFEGRMRRHTW